MSSEILNTLGRSVSNLIDNRDPSFLEEEFIGCYNIILLPGEKILTRTEVKKNSEGYSTLTITDANRVKRFLMFGCCGGTIYAKEQQLTMDNVVDLKDIIHRGRAGLIIDLIREVSLAGKNYKQDGIIIALALCSRYGVSVLSKLSIEQSEHVFYQYLKQMHKDATELVNQVCRIPTHLFAYVKFCEMISADIIVTKEEELEQKNEEPRVFRKRKTTKKFAKKPEGVKKSTGWGRVMRKTIGNWYLSKTPEQLAMMLSKYKQRDGWSHRDVLRLSHPIPHCDSRRIVYEHLFYYAAKGEVQPRKRHLDPTTPQAETVRMKYTEDQLIYEDESEGLRYLERVASLSPWTSVDDIVWAIRHFRLTWEQIPNAHLKSKEIWKALVTRMPMLAMIRNLGKMQSIGLLHDENLKNVVSHVSNAEALSKARVHPLQLLLAKTVYDSGTGDKGSLSWTPKPDLSTALEEAFYSSFSNVTPTNKRYCIAFDTSASMSCKLAGSALTGRVASSAIALTLLKTEQTVECVGFCGKLESLPYDGTWKLSAVTEHMNALKGGETNCSLPMTWATRRGKLFDVFIIFTDNDFNFDGMTPSKALINYRKQSGIDDVRLIVVAMTSTKSTIADPDDRGMIDIVGFDPSLPQIIHDFAMGDF